MPRRKRNVKSFGQGGRTRGRHKNYRSKEVRRWYSHVSEKLKHG